MKYLKNMALVIIGLVAWATIGISNQMQTYAPRAIDDYRYAIELILSVVYLHWALRTFLLPIKQLLPAQVKELRDATCARYANGFLAGTVGAGYFFLVIHVFSFLARSASYKPIGLSMALFLIALGTLAKTRAAVGYLCIALVKKDGGKEDRTTGPSVP